MLQQTQVDRVLPKYHEWLEKYPSLQALADAPEADVTETWRPLGYNIRPRRLHAIARESVERYGGELPSDGPTLRSFKGIGEYTAGAVMSFAFGQRDAILDTNVARVLFRIFVGRGAPKAHAMKRHLWDSVPHRAAASPRLRLQPGADGLRRDALHRAQAEVPDLPDAGRLQGVSRSIPTTNSHDPRRRRRRSSRTTAAISSRDGRKAPISRACGSFPAARSKPANRSRTACGGS